jgi:hypothetical protein
MRGGYLLGNLVQSKLKGMTLKVVKKVLVFLISMCIIKTGHNYVVFDTIILPMMPIKWKTIFTCICPTKQLKGKYNYETEHHFTPSEIETNS